MLNYSKIYVCASAPACVVAFLVACSGPVSTVTDAAAPANTVVTPHTRVPVTEGQNVVYCSTFQLAWNDMASEVIEQDIRLKKPLETVRYLNEGLATRSDVSDDDYLAMAGVGEDAVDEARALLKARYGARAPALSNSYKHGLFAYAFLNKRLRFEHPFEVFSDPPALYGRDGRLHVRGFGIYQYSGARHAVLHDQVEVFHYTDPRDFVIRLVSTNPEDEIIIARVRPGGSLQETIEAVQSRIATREPERLAEGDILVIPNLDASFSHAYTDLMDRYLANEGWEEYYIHDAVQDIRFSLDESGVSVESDMKLAFRQKGPAPTYKVLVCHAPFLIYLKQKSGKHPYFAVWVDNQELMIPSS